jgi:hypothetical protein
MPNIYLFVPPEREAEIVDELRRFDQLDKQFRSFIGSCSLSVKQEE